MSKTKNRGFDSIAVLIVALAAVVVAVWQANLTRQHNRLTVKPFLDVDISVQEAAFLKIKNKGEGAALVTSFELKWDNKKFNDWVELFQAADGLNTVGLSRTFKEGDVIGAHEELVLCQLPTGASKRIGIIIVINYESIYGEPYTFRKKFSWGG